MALKSDGTVWAWGYNADGELGNGTYVNSSVPVQVSGLTGVKVVAAASNHSLALKTDGTIWAWGANEDGVLGEVRAGFDAGVVADDDGPVDLGVGVDLRAFPEPDAVAELEAADVDLDPTVEHVGKTVCVLRE